MSIQASWLTKKWTIDRQAVRALDELSFTKELDVEELDAKDGKSPTNTKGFKAESLTITHRVMVSAGIDPKKEFEEWDALLGKRGGFHVQGRRIGPPALILDKVDMNVTAISNFGDFLDASITLTFNEDTNFKAAPKSATEKKVGDKTANAPGYKPNGEEKLKSAYNVRPTASAMSDKGG